MAITIDGTNGLTTDNAALKLDGTTLVVDDTNNRVGIGTASPAVALDVSGYARASTGILFGTDTAAANALDDYEEGTWTPTDASGAGLSFTYNSTQYTKVGRLVTILLEMTWPSTANGATVSISLPFSASTAARAGMTAFSNVSGEVNIYIGGGANFILFNDTGTQITNATMSGKYLIVSFTYQV